MLVNSPAVALYLNGMPSWLDFPTKDLHVLILVFWQPQNLLGEKLRTEGSWSAHQLEIIIAE